MSETVFVSAALKYDSDGNSIDTAEPTEVRVIAVAPGNTTLTLDTGGDVDVVDFTVYAELDAPINDDDTIVVRGRECRARVRRWVSPWTARGGIEVLCTSATGSSNG